MTIQLKKIRWSVLALTGAVALLAACGGRVDDEPAEVTCYYPNTEAQAPGWVCDQPVEGQAVTAMGSYPESAAGMSFMRQQAAAAARVELAQQVSAQVQAMVRQYAETTGQGETETVDQVNSSVNRVLTNETVAGSRIIESRVAPDGSLYVLVALDDAALQQTAETSLRTSMNRDNALWQQFRAEQGFQALDDALARDIAGSQ